MKFSSPYNRDERIGDDRGNFYAMDEKGTIYDVIEYDSPDKRCKKGWRLARECTDTGKCLLDTPLRVLPPGFDGKDPMKFVMLQLAFVKLQNEDLRCEVESLRNDLDNVERWQDRHGDENYY